MWARLQFINHPYGGPGFDFTLEPNIWADFAHRCHELQTASDSAFVRLTVCHRHTPEGIVSLRGAVLSLVTVECVVTHTVSSLEEYVQTLKTPFTLDLFQAAQLGPRVWEWYCAWVEEQSTASER
jgi:N-hydroxyarylamine O-acetyltransferase